MNTKEIAVFSFYILLMVLLVGLKLTGFIGWSWLWVLFPLWVGIILLAIGFMITFIVSLLLLIVSMVLDKFY